jgi:hypothetical protein
MLQNRHETNELRGSLKSKRATGDRLEAAGTDRWLMPHCRHQTQPQRPSRATRRCRNRRQRTDARRRGQPRLRTSTGVDNRRSRRPVHARPYCAEQYGGSRSWPALRTKRRSRWREKMSDHRSRARGNDQYAAPWGGGGANRRFWKAGRETVGRESSCKSRILARALMISMWSPGGGGGVGRSQCRSVAGNQQYLPALRPRVTSWVGQSPPVGSVVTDG